MRYLLTSLALGLGSFLSAQSINGYEFWFDQDHGSSTTVSTAPTSILDLVAAINLGDPSPGEHSIHYRLRDSNGRWSAVLTKHFTRLVGGPYELISGEYWFDMDDTERIPFALGPGEQVDILLDPDASELDLGEHQVHYRLRDNHAFWSPVITKSFTLRAGGPYELVLLRYWSDPAEQDPSDLTEVPIDPGVQYLDIIDHVLFCNWSSTGATDVYFQLKDANGRWSSVLTDNFTIDAATAPPAMPGPITGLVSPPFSSTQTYTVPPVNGAGAYVWVLPNGWTGSSSTNSIEVVVGSSNDGSPLGVYAVNGCGQSGTTYLDIITGLENLGPGSLQAFPNPTSGLVTVTGTQPYDRITVYNSHGQLIQVLRGSEGRTDLDLTTAADGMYSVRIEGDNGDRHYTVMLQR